jgi:hypothetical protein
VTHGIPYVALVWASRAAEQRPARSGRRVAASAGAFVALIVALAWLEEGLWDGLVWREHSAVFGLFQGLPHLTQAAWLAWLVPLLTVPQATHYVLDGFIWKRSGAQ